MNERPTPETDAEHAQFRMGGFTLDFCRKMERERDEARELAQQMSESNQVLLADVRFYRNERDEAREEINRYREKNDLLPISWDV